MKIFRFTDARYSESLANGTFRFGNARYYRLLENLKDDDWIGDRREAQGITRVYKTLDPTKVKPGELASFNAEALKLGAHVEGTGKVIFNGTQFVSSVPCFILCFSFGDFEEVKKKMCDDNGKSEYSSAVSFTNGETLSRMIWEKGQVSGLGPSGEDIAVNKFFKDWRFGIVKYEKNEDVYSGGNLRQGDPFKKTPKICHSNGVSNCIIQFQRA